MIEKATIVNTRTGKQMTFATDEKASFVILWGGFNVGKVDADHQTFKYPGQVGTFISSTSLDNRDFSMTGYVTAETLDKIKELKKQLSAHINPMDVLEIRIDGYSLYGKAESNVEYGRVYLENNDIFCKFLFNILCNSPLYQKTGGDKIELSIVKPAFHFPLGIRPQVKNGGVIFGKRKKELFSQAENDGAVDVGIEITIKSLGVVNNPQIIFVEQNRFIRINKIMSENEEIKISTIDGERMIIGRPNELSEWESYLDYWDENSSWLALPVGTTTIGFKTSIDGIEDLTYSNSEIIINYKPCLYNLDGE